MKALTQRGDDARQIRKQTIKVVLNRGNVSLAGTDYGELVYQRPTTKGEVQDAAEE
jgi:hypothetical protein